MYIVGITGHRNYPNLGQVEDFVVSLPDRTVICTGKARGVDRAARAAALKRGFLVLDAPVEDEHVKRYGLPIFHVRNGLIVHVSDEIVGFWDGRKKGGTYECMVDALVADKLAGYYTPSTTVLVGARLGPVADEADARRRLADAPLGGVLGGDSPHRERDDRTLQHAGRA